MGDEVGHRLRTPEGHPPRRVRRSRSYVQPMRLPYPGGRFGFEPTERLRADAKAALPLASSVSRGYSRCHSRGASYYSASLEGNQSVDVTVAAATNGAEEMMSQSLT